METENYVRADLCNYKTASNLLFNEQVKIRQRNGEKLFNFAFGESPFPVPECLQVALKDNPHHKSYLPMTGLPDLRKEVIKFHLKYDDLTLDPEGIIFSPGCKEIIFLIMLTFEGEILIPAPAWTTYAPQAKLAGKNRVVMATSFENEFRITASSLEEYAGKRQTGMHSLLILTNPGNPSGICYSEKELKEISVVCDQNKILVISDEIYARLAFTGKHHSMNKYYPGGTILVSGFSKWASIGGWRAGYAHFPSSLSGLYATVRSAASHTYSCAAAPVQYALIQALQNGAAELDLYMFCCRKILEALANYCFRELTEVGIKTAEGQAGYYLLIDFECIRSGLQRRGIETGTTMVATMLEEAKVAMIASDAFLMSTSDLKTRLCFVCFNGTQALDILMKSIREMEIHCTVNGNSNGNSHRGSISPNEKVAKDILTDTFLQQHCKNVLDGIQCIKEWVCKHK